MFSLDAAKGWVVGPHGQLHVPAGDYAIRKLVMLLEGQCLGLGGTAAARKYGYSKPRYFQLVRAVRTGGLDALTNHQRGPKGRSRRTDEVAKQIIRHRFLDPEASCEVIAGKLRQAKFSLSVRSVRRVLDEYHLQKKTLRRGARVAGHRR